MPIVSQARLFKHCPYLFFIGTAEIVEGWQKKSRNLSFQHREPSVEEQVAGANIPPAHAKDVAAAAELVAGVGHHNCPFVRIAHEPSGDEIESLLVPGPVELQG